MQNLALLLAVLALVACEPTSDSSAPPAPQAVQAQPSKRPPEKEQAQIAPAPLENRPALPRSTPPMPPAVDSDKPETAAVVRSPAVQKPLDLSLPSDLFDPLPAAEPEHDLTAPLLPPLFDSATADESPYQFNGQLITHDGDDDAWYSVDGAQLQLEFKR
jgi:hypothetical protein